jgi:hypothetical protein
MKPLLVLLVLIAAALAVYLVSTRTSAPTGAMPPGANPTGGDLQPTSTKGDWEGDFPGMKEIDPALAEFDVQIERRNEGPQYRLYFHVTEKNGHAAAGITVAFWYRYKDDDTGQWVDHPKQITFFMKKPLMPNQTLTDYTTLWEAEWRDQVDFKEVVASTSENWQGKVVNCMRLMTKADK